MKSWIIPCNVKFYDVINHFNDRAKIIWKKGCPVKKGDIVYLYVGIPYKKILYKCIVKKENLYESDIQDDRYAIVKGSIENKYMELHLIERWKEGISLSTLKELGMVLVRKQTRLSGKLLEYIDGYEE